MTFSPVWRALPVRLEEDARVRWLDTMELGGLAGQAVQEVEILLIGGAEPLDEFAADRAEDLDGGGGLEAAQNADGSACDSEEFAILERLNIS